jgi:carboxylesterase
MTNLASATREFYTGPEHQPFTIGAANPAALLIHGFAGTPAEMRPLANELELRAIGSTGILLPGFGPAIATLGQTRRGAWLDSAREAWQSLRSRSDQAVLIGYSMGGSVALQLASQASPDALVLIAPFSRIDSWLFRLLPLVKHVAPDWRPVQDADFDDPEVREQLAQTMPGLDLNDPETQQFLRKEVKLPLSALDELRHMGNMAYAAASKVAAPTLIVQGQNDTTVAPSTTRALAERLAGPVIYHEIGAGHDVIRQPSLFMPVVDNFLRAHVSLAVG